MAMARPSAQERERERTFNFDRHGRGALVKDAVLGAMVEEASHSNALLLASGESTEPIAHIVPVPLIQNRLRRVNKGEKLLKILQS